MPCQQRGLELLAPGDWGGSTLGSHVASKIDASDNAAPISSAAQSRETDTCCGTGRVAAPELARQRDHVAPT
nr:unnamed protein product [Digitaria exilis]